MTPTLRVFTSRLRVLGVDTSCFDSADSSATRLTIPPQREAVGPIVVHDDDIELTIEIGTKHHTHFGGNGHVSASKSDQLHRAAIDAASFVNDLMADCVCIATHFLDDRCIGSSHFYLDAKNLTADTVRDSLEGLMGGHIRSVRYLWSGPV